MKGGLASQEKIRPTAAKNTSHLKAHKNYAACSCRRIMPASEETRRRACEGEGRRKRRGRLAEQADEAHRPHDAVFEAHEHDGGVAAAARSDGRPGVEQPRGADELLARDMRVAVDDQPVRAGARRLLGPAGKCETNRFTPPISGVAQSPTADPYSSQSLLPLTATTGAMVSSSHS